MQQEVAKIENKAVVVQKAPPSKMDLVCRKALNIIPMVSIADIAIMSATLIGVTFRAAGNVIALAFWGAILIVSETGAAIGALKDAARSKCSGSGSEIAEHHQDSSNKGDVNINVQINVEK